MRERLHQARQALSKRVRRTGRLARAQVASIPSFGSARLVAAALIGFLLVAMVYLAQSSNAAMVSRELRVKQLRIEELDREIAQLRYEIGALSSPAAVEVRAREQGLGPPKNVIYMDMPWLAPEVEDTMPAFLAYTQPPVPQRFATETGVLEEFLALLGFGSNDRAANAQTR